MGMVTMSDVLEMATGEGILPVDVQAMLCDVIAALGMHAVAAGAGVGMVTMSDALEMATGEGILPVAVQAMLARSRLSRW